MKKVLLSLLLFIGTMVSRAEKALVVYTAEGRAVAFVVADEPRITATAEEVTLTAGNKSVSYALSALDHFILEEVDMTGIADNPTPSTMFRIGSDGLRCEGLVPGQRVQVYDLGGRQVCQGMADEGGSLLLPMRRGTYVIKIGNKTFKTTKQ